MTVVPPHHPGFGRSRRISHALLGWAFMGIWPLTALLPGLAALLSWFAGVR